MCVCVCLLNVCSFLTAFPYFCETYSKWMYHIFYKLCVRKGILAKTSGICVDLKTGSLFLSISSLSFFQSILPFTFLHVTATFNMFLGHIGIIDIS